MGMAKMALMALLMLHMGSAAQQNQMIMGFSQPDADATEFIAIAFAFVSAVIALAYMYAKIKEDAGAEAWAKNEAQNLLITVFLFVGLAAFFNASCALAEGYVGKNPFKASNEYLDALLKSNGNEVIRALTYRSIDDQMKATYYRYIGMTPFFGSGAATKSAYKSLSSHKELLIDIYLPIIASLTAQKYALQAIEWVSVSVLLPFAFVLRIIPLTRDFGNSMIAVFFALYILVPTTYAMSGAVYNGIVETPTLSSGLNVFYSYGLDGRGDWTDPTKSVLYKVGSTIPQAVFIPNLVMVIAISCIMALSKALKAVAA